MPDPGSARAPLLCVTPCMLCSASDSPLPAACRACTCCLRACPTASGRRARSASARLVGCCSCQPGAPLPAHACAPGLPCITMAQGAASAGRVFQLLASQLLPGRGLPRAAGHARRHPLQLRAAATPHARESPLTCAAACSLDCAAPVVCRSQPECLHAPLSAACRWCSLARTWMLTSFARASRSAW